MIGYVKRRILFILVFFVSSFSVFSEESIAVCDHAFMPDTVSMPTCTEEGSVKFTCGMCHDTTYYEALPMVAHILLQDSVGATCQQAGHLSDSCVVCNQILSQVELPMLDHAFMPDTVSMPTCTEEGNVRFTCGMCHDTTYYEALPMVAHILLQDSVGATCQQAGHLSDSCVVCNQVLSQVELPMLGHTFMPDTVSLPTCTEEGSVKFTCGMCHDTTYYEALPLVAHILLQDSVGATCQQAGHLSDSCVVCNQVLSQVELPMLGHAFMPDTVSMPTCTEEGSVKFICGMCHDTTYYEALPLVAHILLQDSVGATCQQAGHLSDSCVVCNQVLSQVELPMLDHAFMPDTVSLPTCTEEGSVKFTCGMCHDTTYYETLPMVAHILLQDSVGATCQQAGHLSDSCVVCNQILSQVELPMLGHTFMPDTVSMPTCTEEGNVRFTCVLNHDSVYYEILPFLGHSWVKDSVAATCHHGGYCYEYCAVCNTVIKDNIYPMLEHLYVVTEVPATCTENGILEKICSICNDSVTETIMTMGHMTSLEYIAPSCDTPGYDISVCGLCHKTDTLYEYMPSGHMYSYQYIPSTCQHSGYDLYVCEYCHKADTLYEYMPSGHMYSYELIKSPTCTENGLELRTCMECGYSEEYEYPAYGHWFMDEIYEPATCTKDGIQKGICLVCNETICDTLKAIGHRYSEWKQDPTPLEYGYTVHTCMNCGDEYRDHKVDKIEIETYYSPLKFSEIMPCNISTVIHPSSYNFKGYLELSSLSSHSIKLAGCVLNHYKKTSGGKYSLKWSHTLGETSIIDTSRCLIYPVLWADADFPGNLDADGGYLTLYAGDYLIDSIAYGAMEPHVAYGRKGSVEGYMLPTPGSNNSEAFPNLLTDRCAQPTFSVDPGVLSGATDITMSCSTAGAAIYYTLDGTEPSATNGLLYMEPIEVSANTNIRAIACLTGKLPSKIVTGSYILMDKQHAACGGFTVPIVSITMDNLYYSDPGYGMFVVGSNGIRGEKDCQREYANYNQDWKRPMNFEYFVDGKRVVSQEVEAAIEGGCSRGNDIKSFSMKTSKKSGASQFDYHFFESKPDVFTRTLHMRNGGTAYECIPYRDGLMQTFAHGMNIDYQAYQPVAYYRNGQYIGMMALNERTNSDYIKSNHGYDEEDIDVLTVSDQLGIRVSKGSSSAYDELVSYLNDNKPTNPNYYAGACSKMDMDEYIDYQIFQQFIVNTDWPGNNTKIWRAKDNGLFRWILFDTDFGFGLCNYEWIGTPDFNMIDWCRGEGMITSWANQQSWMVNIFKPLSDNEEFKKKFTTRFLINLSDRFSSQNINAVFDSVIGVISHEICADSRSSYRGSVESMRSFALSRPANIYKHLASYVGGGSAVDFSLSTNVEGAVLTLNGEKLPSSYNGKYITGYNFDLEAYAPMGYVFDKWEISDSSNIKIANSVVPKGAFMPGILSGKVTNSLSLKAIFKKGSSALPTLVINEVCASSNSKSDNADDYGNYPDWIELHNYGTKDIDLAGFRLTNAKSGKVSELPYDAENMVIKAGEHKLLWAKGDNRRGANYLDFKLDNDKASQICLSYFDAVGEVDVDCIRYKTHATNESYGRVEDNSDDWTIFGICEDSESYAATPGNVNGSTCEKYSTETTETWVEESGLTLYPNPASDYLNVATEEEILSYTIYDMSGAPLRQDVGNATTISVEGLYAGLYMIEVRTVSDVYRMKFLKE